MMTSALIRHLSLLSTLIYGCSLEWYFVDCADRWSPVLCLYAQLRGYDDGVLDLAQELEPFLRLCTLFREKLT